MGGCGVGLGGGRGGGRGVRGRGGHVRGGCAVVWLRVHGWVVERLRLLMGGAAAGPGCFWVACVVSLQRVVGFPACTCEC